MGSRCSDSIFLGFVEGDLKLMNARILILIYCRPITSVSVSVTFHVVLFDIITLLLFYSKFLIDGDSLHAFLFWLNCSDWFKNHPFYFLTVGRSTNLRAIF